ncbi:MAG: uridine diphosphate-N-acetylglucosamine-binding protein YvcK [Armatimonadota bacterium]
MSHPVGRRDRIVKGFQWLAPGLRVKRWLLLIPIGLAPVVAGVALLVGVRVTDWFDTAANIASERTGIEITAPSFFLPVGIGGVLVGLSCILAALIAVNRSIVSVVSPDDLSNLPEVIRRKRQLSQGLRIVVIGGGTGLSTLLRGLKRHTSNLTAIVATTDDGGSSGLLQQQLGGILPPGDIRNCLVALADTEPLMQELFQYRFNTRDDRDGLSGHSFGNLFLAAMTEVTGDFEKAVEAASAILAIRGRVLPSTVEPVVLVGEMADGREVTGESRITKDPAPIRRIRLCPDEPKALPAALDAIAEADVLVLGPGSVYTSIIPNLLVPGIAEAVATSTALRCYVCNIMTQRGETDHFAASDHIRVIAEHAEPFLAPGQRIVDHVLINGARPDAEAIERYHRSGSDVVSPDHEVISRMGYRPVKGTFLASNEMVRHDADRLADAIVRLAEEG